MLKQTIKIIFFTLLLGINLVYSANITDILSKQEALAKKVLIAYKKHKIVALLKQINILKVQNKQLRHKIRDSEIRNLLVFLDICFDEMIVTLKKPYSKDNAQIVADLSISIKEGTNYVKKALKI
jgi:predicted RNase H-like nuclease